MAIRLSCTVAIYFTCPIYATCDSLIILKHDNTHICTCMHLIGQKESIKERKHDRIDPRGGVAHRQCICLVTKKGTETSIKNNWIKLLGEVGTAVQKSIQTRVVGITRYMLHPYRFSLKYHYLKSSRDVTCILLSLLPLFVYSFVLPSLLHPSILSNCFYACLLIYCTFSFKCGHIVFILSIMAGVPSSNFL